MGACEPGRGGASTRPARVRRRRLGRTPTGYVSLFRAEPKSERWPDIRRGKASARCRPGSADQASSWEPGRQSVADSIAELLPDMGPAHLPAVFAEPMAEA